MRPDSHRYPMRLMTAVLVAAISGCGGGSSTKTDTGTEVLTPSEVEEFVSDPRVSSVLDIVAASDTLLVPAAHVRYSLSGPEQSIQGDVHLEFVSCESMRCVATDGTEIDLSDITSADFSPGAIGSFDNYPTGLIVTEANLVSNQGLTTATLRARVDAADIVNLLDPGDEIASLPSASVFGLWGQYGFAGMVIVDGAIAGTLDGSAYRGLISASLPLAIGEASHTNPMGIGGATWTGIAEAVSARTFERRQGTATVTIPDLSRPPVGVEIDVDGYQIGSPAWAAMPLVRGRDGAGRAGIDHLQGSFHGSTHSETYGVFDTGAYDGVFGATRTSNP